MWYHFSQLTHSLEYVQPGTWGPPKGAAKDNGLDDIFGKKVEVSVQGLSPEQVSVLFLRVLRV